MSTSQDDVLEIFSGLSAKPTSTMPCVYVVPLELPGVIRLSQLARPAASGARSSTFAYNCVTKAVFDSDPYLAMNSGESTKPSETERLPGDQPDVSPPAGDHPP